MRRVMKAMVLSGHGGLDRYEWRDDWPVPGPLEALIDIVARGGRDTCSGAIAGPMVPLDLRSRCLRDLAVTGSTVVPSRVFRDVVGCIERGEGKPARAATWPLRERPAAQPAFIDKPHAGNIVAVP